MATDIHTIVFILTNLLIVFAAILVAMSFWYRAKWAQLRTLAEHLDGVVVASVFSLPVFAGVYKGLGFKLRLMPGVGIDSPNMLLTVFKNLPCRFRAVKKNDPDTDGFPGFSNPTATGDFAFDSDFSLIAADQAAAAGYFASPQVQAAVRAIFSNGFLMLSTDHDTVQVLKENYTEEDVGPVILVSVLEQLAKLGGKDKLITGAEIAAAGRIPPSTKGSLLQLLIALGCGAVGWLFWGMMGAVYGIVLMEALFIALIAMNDRLK